MITVEYPSVHLGTMSGREESTLHDTLPRLPPQRAGNGVRLPLADLVQQASGSALRGWVVSRPSPNIYEASYLFFNRLQPLNVKSR